MASTYQTNRAGAGGGTGISEPYVQGVVVGDWSTSSVPGVKSTGSVYFPDLLFGQDETFTESITITGPINGARVYNVMYQVDFGGSKVVDMFNLINDINNDTASEVTASGGFGTLNLEADVEGVAGNSITISFDENNFNFTGIPSTSPPATIVGSIHTANLAGGVDPIADPDYTLTIDAATHDKGTEPTVTLYEENGGLFEEIDTYVAIDATGNITIKVPVSPDGRFTGKIVVN